MTSNLATATASQMCKCPCYILEISWHKIKDLSDLNWWARSLLTSSLHNLMKTFAIHKTLRMWSRSMVTTDHSIISCTVTSWISPKTLIMWENPKWWHICFHAMESRSTWHLHQHPAFLWHFQKCKMSKRHDVYFYQQWNACSGEISNSYTVQWYTFINM